jgi:hypothetical protein
MIGNHRAVIRFSLPRSAREIVSINIVLILVGCVVGFELVTVIAVHQLRKRCQWLLVKADEFPVVDTAVCEKFIESSWDPELGWIRRPSSAKDEAGEDGSVSRYHIDEGGSRVNPGFEEAAAEIFLYGDSYAFSRQVNDDETWAHHLSNALQKNVVNKGVGNYGVDQALIRLEREPEAKQCRMLIMAVVPETIGRVHSVWKHYSEYGNTLAFKPRFYLADGELGMISNLLNDEKKFEDFPSLALAARTHDYFYDRKFKRDIFTFPYSLCLWRENGRNIKLLYAAFLDLFDHGERAFVSVMRRNVELTARMYRDPEIASLLKSIILRFSEFSKANGIVPLFVLMPQLMDLERIKSHGPYYDDFIRDISEHTNVADLTEPLLEMSSLSGLYINDVYGGHFSAKGNQFVAAQLTPVCQKLLNPS